MYNYGGPIKFIHATDHANMVELPSLGGDFTWSNNSPGVNSKQNKLDSAFTNEEFVRRCPEARNEFHSVVSSESMIMPP